MNSNVLTLSDILSAIRAERWVVVGVVAISLLVGGAVAIFGTPVYRAEISVIPVAENQEGLLGGMDGEFGLLASVAGIDINSGSSKNEALAILKSRAFTREFIQRYELTPILFADRWSVDQRAWLVPEDAPTTWDAVNYFDKEIRGVFEDNSTGVVRLTIDWSDRMVAAQWANRLIEDLNSQMRRRAILEAEKSISYLNEQLDQTALVDLKTSIYRLIEENIKRTMLANVRDEYVFRLIDEAMPPDEDDYVFPNRPLIMALSLAIGCTFAGILVFVRRFGFAVEPRSRGVLAN